MGCQEIHIIVFWKLECGGEQQGLRKIEILTGSTFQTNCIWDWDRSKLYFYIKCNLIDRILIQVSFPLSFIL